MPFNIRKRKHLTTRTVLYGAPSVPMPSFQTPFVSSATAAVTYYNVESDVERLKVDFDKIADDADSAYNEIERIKNKLEGSDRDIAERELREIVKPPVDDRNMCTNCFEFADECVCEPAQLAEWMRRWDNVAEEAEVVTFDVDQVLGTTHTVAIRSGATVIDS